jgi:acyl-CoA reductase-like NAD-dependent aldehyde dehydrogenase
MARTAVSGYGNFIGGVFSSQAETFVDLNPAQPDDVVGAFPSSGDAEIIEAVSAAEEALPAWRRLSPVTRGKYLLAMARELRSRGDEIAAAITREQGKPLAESRGELAKPADDLDYYAFAAYDLGGRTIPSAREDVDLLLERGPVGVVALITPWNIPIAGPTRKLAPALVCGNTVVLKPSEETPLAAHLLAEAAADAGLPPGVLGVVHGDGSRAGASLVRDERVRAVSFTGSTEVGREVARVAADRFARVQLELGGKNAAIVLDDCDLQHAVTQIVPAAFGGSGQQCTASSRLLIQRDVVGAFMETCSSASRSCESGPATRTASRSVLWSRRFSSGEFSRTSRAVRRKGLRC